MRIEQGYTQAVEPVSGVRKPNSKASTPVAGIGALFDTVDTVSISDEARKAWMRSKELNDTGEEERSTRAQNVRDGEKQADQSKKAQLPDEVNALVESGKISMKEAMLATFRSGSAIDPVSGQVSHNTGLTTSMKKDLSGWLDKAIGWETELSGQLGRSLGDVTQARIKLRDLLQHNAA